MNSSHDHFHLMFTVYARICNDTNNKHANLKAKILENPVFCYFFFFGGAFSLEVSILKSKRKSSFKRPSQESYFT